MTATRHWCGLGTRQEFAIKIAIITQARLSSTRLPGKVLLRAGGRSYLDHHLDRLAPTGLPVVIATTTEPAEEPIVELARERGVAFSRGSLDDVLSRFLQAAGEHDVDTIVRVTSDCPLIDAELIMAGVAAFTEAADTAGSPDRLYVTNTLTRSYPRGMDYEIFSTATLREAGERATVAFEREHVTPWLYRNPELVRAINLPRADDASRYRLTLDTVEDEQLLRRLIEDNDAASLSCDELVTLLAAHPELAALNSAVEQKKLGQ